MVSIIYAIPLSARNLRKGAHQAGNWIVALEEDYDDKVK
jgi:hypothetical protein